MLRNIWWLLLVALIFLAVIGLWRYVGFLPAKNQIPGFDLANSGTPDLNRAGVFGDSFGWINSLFSALAFAGVIVTILLQTRELRLQHTEMRQARHEMILQNKIMCATSRMGATGSLASAYATLVSGQPIEERERVNTLGIHVDGIESHVMAGNQLDENYVGLIRLAIEHAEALPDSEQKRVFITFSRAFVQRFERTGATDEHALRGLCAISKAFPSRKLQDLEQQLRQQERELQELLEQAAREAERAE